MKLVINNHSNDINITFLIMIFFYKLIYKPSYCNFQESRKKINLISKLFFLFYPPTLNII